MFNVISTSECGSVVLHSQVGPLISIISVLRSTWLTSPVAGMMDWPSMPSFTATGTVKKKKKKMDVCVCGRQKIEQEMFRLPNLPSYSAVFFFLQRPYCQVENGCRPLSAQREKKERHRICQVVTASKPVSYY